MAIQKYDISGFYMYNRDQGLLEGVVELDTETNRFNGEIHDSMSRNPIQKINGLVELTKRTANIYFTKYPKDSNLANLIYRLKKNNSGIEGNYMGRWMASTEKMITSTINNNLVEILTKDPSVEGSGDYAQLSFHLIG
jgi:hypothetical protein